MADRTKVWLCGACGKQNADRTKVGDESCYMHSVLVFADSIKRTGASVSATAVPEIKDIDITIKAG